MDGRILPTVPSPRPPVFPVCPSENTPGAEGGSMVLVGLRKLLGPNSKGWAG
jgi:hypothetical protein